MSVSGISNTSLFNYAAESLQNRRQQFGKEFEQLGKDLQAGDLSAAQADFAALQQLKPQSSTTSSSQNATPLANDFNQLSQDLQTGNLSAAQQDYAKVLQDMQTQASQAHGHHRHHHGGQSGSNPIEQSLQQLGQALQANDLSSAQQAYAALQQEFQQMQAQHGASFANTGSNSGSFSVSA
jgi:hypothetical protein